MTASFAVWRRSLSVGNSCTAVTPLENKQDVKSDVSCLVWHNDRMHIQINHAEILRGAPL
jgi:actin-related protein